MRVNSGGYSIISPEEEPIIPTKSSSSKRSSRNMTNTIYAEPQDTIKIFDSIEDMLNALLNTNAQNPIFYVSENKKYRISNIMPKSKKINNSNSNNKKGWIYSIINKNIPLNKIKKLTRKNNGNSSHNKILDDLEISVLIDNFRGNSNIKTLLLLVTGKHYRNYRIALKKVGEQVLFDNKYSTEPYKNISNEELLRLLQIKQISKNNKIVNAPKSSKLNARPQIVSRFSRQKKLRESNFGG